MPKTVGEYELLEEIGRGGMGVVWKARQKRLNRDVALKLVREGCLPGEAAAKRFRREAEAAAAIQHPHIVTIHEVGEADDRLYLSMELVPGGSLADWMKRVAFSARDAATLVAKVARAVHHAHQQGVMHRDLKPANILLDAADEPRVCDFGLARLIEDTSTLTMTGEVLGTPAYLSPEQASGTRAVTPASDTYSLGAILYELLSGRPPFAASTLPALLRAVAEDDPQRPISRVSGRRVPVDLSTICLKCLEKEPTARYATALALGEDLERWVRGEPIHARPVARVERVWKWARRKPLLAFLWLMTTVATVAIAIVSTVMSIRLSKEKQMAKQAAADTQHEFARSLSDSAQRYMNAGDWFRALPPLAEALEIGSGNPRLDEINRIRFGMLRRMSPKLAQYWSRDALVRADTTRDGTRIMLAFQHRVEVRDTTTGQIVGKPWITEKFVSGAVFDNHRGAWAGIQIAEDCLVWEPDTGMTQPAGKGYLYSSPEGAMHLNGHFITHIGQTAEVRSRTTGDRVGQVFDHQSRVVWAALLPGMNRALTRDEKGLLYLWDIDTSSLVMEPFTLPEMANKPPSFDAFDPISKVAVLHSERTIWMVDCQTGSARVVPVPSKRNSMSGTPVADRALTKESPQSFGIDKAKRWLYMTRNNDGIVVRDLETGEILWIAQHGALGFRGDFGGNSETVATQSANGSTRVWKTSTNRPLTPLLWQAATPGSCEVDPNGRWILTQGDEPAARLWLIPEDDGSSELPNNLDSAVGMWFAGVPERMFMADEKGGVTMWDLKQGTRPSSTVSHPENIRWAGPAGGGARVFTAGNKIARLSDSATGAVVGKEYALAKPPKFATADPSGERIAVVEEDGTVRLWDVTTGQETVLAGRAETVEFSNDGRVLLSITEQACQTWNPVTGQPLCDPVVEPEGEARAVLSPDGSRVAQWTAKGSGGQHAARVWDSATGKVVCELAHHWQGILSAAFSPDGSLVATGGGDHMLHLSDARTGRDVVPPMRHPQKIDRCGFTSDGLLLWALADSDIIIWDTIAGEQVTPRLRHPRYPLFISTSADARHLAMLGNKGGTRIWDLSPDEHTHAELNAIARALSAHGIVPGSGSLSPLPLEEAKAAWKSTRAILGGWPE